MKPVNLIVITDGVPTDDPESVLLSFAKRLDKVDAPPPQGPHLAPLGGCSGQEQALRRPRPTFYNALASLRASEEQHPALELECWRAVRFECACEVAYKAIIKPSRPFYQ
jgi:hypothetical protein